MLRFYRRDPRGLNKASRPPARLVWSVSVRAYPVAQPPLAGITAEGGGAPCITMNGADCVKQSQQGQLGRLRCACKGIAGSVIVDVRFLISKSTINHRTSNLLRNAVRRHYEQGRPRQTKPTVMLDRRRAQPALRMSARNKANSDGPDQS
jgi:hypothetical protein